VVVTHVDMLGARAQLRESRELLCARIVFKDFAVDVGLCANDLEPIFFHFLDEEHDGENIS